MSFSHLTMTLNHELGTQTWSRYGQGVSDYSEWKFPASEFENEQTHTHRDTDKSYWSYYLSALG